MAGRLEQSVCLLGEPGVPFLDGPVESFGAARLAQAVQDRPNPGQRVAGLAEHADHLRVADVGWRVTAVAGAAVAIRGQQASRLPDPQRRGADLELRGDLPDAQVSALNIAVGRTAFEKLTGYPAGEHEAQSVRLDYTAPDRLIPHPAYAAQAWVAILNPGEAAAGQARSLFTDAHALAVRRHDRRRG
jgi:Family of unknown function (DUF6194)